MELDIQEKIRKDREEKEARAIKDSSVVSASNRDKGKGPMEGLPQETVSQQVKALIHTFQQFKQKLTKMTSMLDTQEIATNHPFDNVQITTAVTQEIGDPVMAEIRPLQILKVQVPSSSAHTIDLTNSDKEEKEVSHVPITEEEGYLLQDFLDLFNSKAKNNSIPVLEIQQPPSVSEP